MEQPGGYIGDPFAHEQNLVIEEPGATLLVTGCAHRGILNILEHFRTLYDRLPTHVIGGFHLFDRTTGRAEDPATIDRIGETLRQTNALFHTCHCTGPGPYRRLQATMGTQLGYMQTGRVLSI